MAEFTENFGLINSQQTKRIALVFTIDGLETKLSNRPIGSKILYGDPDVFYGMPGVVYGGLRRLDNVKDYLSLEGSSLTISQRLEPEQGRGAVTTLTLSFIDKDGFMTEVVSPGFLLDEILGREVTVEMGYEELSYPADYFVIFRGFISQVEARSGLVVLQLSDPNIKRRQNIFFSAATTTDALISNVATTIPVVSAGDFHKQITGPNGGYDPAVTTLIKIEDEFIEYPATGISGNSFVTVTRGTRGTTAVAHDAGTDVESYVQLEDQCIDMALKLMLSGWNGPWISGAAITAFVDSGFGLVSNAVIFPPGIDVDKEYGLVVGDQVIITGATNPLNNVTRNITSILDVDESENRLIVLDGAALATETLTSATAAFRSQYDVYPTSCGMKLTPRDVDVAGHLELKAAFLNSSENSYDFLINGQQSGKTFVESEIYLPVSAYSVTRRGRLSVKMTKSALAGSVLIILNEDNILNAQSIAPKRGTNTRKFFNDIVVQYDKSDAGEFLSTFRVIDTDSLNMIGLSSTLPIKSSGIKTPLAVDTPGILERRANFLLSRYKRGAVEISLKVNFEAGVQIEAGDVVALDGTNLFISNFDTGNRDFGVQLFEVVNRSMDLRNGTVDLTLISGVGANLTDRFATISPSSLLTAASTSSVIEITESFTVLDPAFPFNEQDKWENYTGLKISVHNEDYSVYEETNFIAFQPGNNHQLIVSPSLSFTPLAGYILDIPYYPDTTFSVDSALYKAVHAHLNPQVVIITGISVTQFTVGVSDALLFAAGQYISIHDGSFTVESPEVIVDSVVGVTITVRSTLGFVPSVGQLVELIGFADGGGAYRVI